MGATFSQFFPPAPTLTENNLPSQQGKVFIVTGGTSGVGLELCIVLYHAGGKVYMAGRSKANADAAITKIKSLSTSTTTTPGELIFLDLHLDDLSTIKSTTERFIAAETRLDVLFNNAGVAHAPRDIHSTQDHEMQLATNCLGPYLLTQLLLPTLRNTAQSSDPGTVRVVWTASIAVDVDAPTGGMVETDYTEPPWNNQRRYTNSKTGNVFLATELARQVHADADRAVLSVVQNPGNLKSLLTRHMPSWIAIVAGPLLYHPRMGAYTELWAGLSPELGVRDGGTYIVPWGRRHPAYREDLVKACKPVEEGGTGLAERFVGWCDRVTERFR